MSLINFQELVSYSLACLELAHDLRLLQSEGFNNIVMPSRGAYPFFLHANLYLQRDFKDHLSKTNELIRLRPIYLPFTSDIGVEGNAEFPSSVLRKFWCKVMADTINQENSTHVKFYDLLVKDIGNRTLGMNTLELLPNKKGKFVFIDTVISGRAAFEILTALDELGVEDYFAILIIDNNGAKLQKEYSEFIYKKVAQHKVKLIYVERLFSEDASPLLNCGISSIVFPTLIAECLDKVSEFRNTNCAAAGLWFLDSTAHLYGSELNGIKGIFFTLVCTGIDFCEDKVDEQYIINILNHHNEKVLVKAQENRFFSPAFTKRLLLGRFNGKLLKEQVEITGSHVCRVSLENQIIKDLIRKLN